MYCGTVKESAPKDDKIEKENIFKLVDIKQTLKDIPDFSTANEEIAKDFEPSKEGCIVPKRTDLDFSNGGFLSTKIDNRNVDSTGKSTDRTITNKLKYNHNYILSSMGIQQTYRNSIWKVKTFSDRLGLPVHVQERASEVFRKMYHSKANIHNSNNMVCACVYYACKEHKINRKMSDIALTARQELEGTKPLRKSIFLCYQAIIFDLGMPMPKYFTAAQEISYVGNKIGLPQSTILYSINMYDDIKSNERLFFSGKSPKLTATVLLYISSLIHNDFIKYDSIEIENFCDVVGGGISQYILKKRAQEYLSHPLFCEYKKKQEQRQIII